MDVDGYPLQTWNTYGPITASDPGNKLYNRLYFKVKATAAGCYTLEVTPTDGGDLIVFTTVGGPFDDQGAGVAETIPATFTLNEEGVFAVGSLGGEASFTVKLYSTPSGC